MEKILDNTHVVVITDTDESGKWVLVINRFAYASGMSEIVGQAYLEGFDARDIFLGSPLYVELKEKFPRL